MKTGKEQRFISHLKYGFSTKTIIEKILLRGFPTRKIFKEIPNNTFEKRIMIISRTVARVGISRERASLKRQPTREI
jgi:hypothetical protein